VRPAGRFALLPVAALAALCLGTPAPLAAADAATECEVPADLLQVDRRLTHVADRLAAHKPINIVAVGGASTVGQAAGSTELAYPHRLQLALAATFPDAQWNVVNKGMPRQSARQMLQRFPTDVFAEDPVLVIWEVGINDAVRGTNVDDFATTLQAGIDELKNRAIDIILVDMQFSRSTATVIDFERYLNTLHRVGDLNEVYVFPRYEMMRYWSEQNMFNFDEVSTEERAKLAARVYECLGRKLAHVIKLALK
jgi:acyl-CoA thioesterase I